MTVTMNETLTPEQQALYERWVVAADHLRDKALAVAADHPHIIRCLQTLPDFTALALRVLRVQGLRRREWREEELRDMEHRCRCRLKYDPVEPEWVLMSDEELRAALATPVLLAMAPLRRRDGRAAIRQWYLPCLDRGGDIQCSQDRAAEYLSPDGTISVEYDHCY